MKFKFSNDIGERLMASLVAQAQARKAAVVAPTLSDEECDAFRRAPLSFNDMVRLIHEDGFYQGVVAQEDAQ